MKCESAGKNEAGNLYLFLDNSVSTFSLIQNYWTTRFRSLYLDVFMRLKVEMCSMCGKVGNGTWIFCNEAYMTFWLSLVATGGLNHQP